MIRGLCLGTNSSMGGSQGGMSRGRKAPCPVCGRLAGIRPGRAGRLYPHSVLTAREAYAELTAMMAGHDDEDTDFEIGLRMRVIGGDDDSCDGDADPDELARAARLIAILDAPGDRDGRELLTALCLDFSVCPLHRTDYASCFDDDDPECAAIRAVHPNHDT